MFDVGFSELLLCFVVALVVLGPERLPKVARTVGRWTGQARAYLRNLSTELDRESQLAELRQQLADANKLMRDQQQSVQTLLKDSAKPLADLAKDADPKP